MAVFWIAWRCGCLGRQALRPFLTKVALGAVAGTLLAAPMLVAMATYLTHADLGSIRAVTSAACTSVPRPCLSC